MKAHAKKAFEALKAIGATVIDHSPKYDGDLQSQWGAHFILSGELQSRDDKYFADHYGEEFKEEVKDGKIINACGIRQDVIEILHKNGLFAEWIDPGTVGIYDA